MNNSQNKYYIVIGWRSEFPEICYSNITEPFITVNKDEAETLKNKLSAYNPMYEYEVKELT